jgi:hypothetical protein
MGLIDGLIYRLIDELMKGMKNLAIYESIAVIVYGLHLS